MFSKLLCVTTMAALAWCPSAGWAQILSEQAEGISRICTYGPPDRVLSSGGRQRTLEVGIAENCPLTYPPGMQRGLPAPPSARLSSQTQTANNRACVYEQAGRSWTFFIAVTKSCPLYGGMIDQGQVLSVKK